MLNWEVGEYKGDQIRIQNSLEGWNCGLEKTATIIANSFISLFNLFHKEDIIIMLILQVGKLLKVRFQGLCSRGKKEGN